MDFDDILPKIGGYGPYQLLLFCLVVTPCLISVGFGYVNFLFVSATPEHWCYVPELDHLNLTLEEKKNLSLPMERINGLFSYSSCKMYDINYTRLMLGSEELYGSQEDWPQMNCKYGWNYDRSLYDNSLVTEMNIVCDQAWLVTLANSMYYVGGIVGSLWIGYVADKWGRRIGLIAISGLYIAISILSCFPTSYELYVVYRAIIGQSFPAFFQVPFVIAMEVLAVEKRTRDGMLCSAFFSVGCATTAGISYALKDWYNISLATSIPLLFLLIYWFTVPESPRWLVSQNRMDEAEEIIQTIARTNKKVIEKNFLKNNLSTMYTTQNVDKDSKKATDPSYLDLLRYPTMKKNFIILSFDWSVICLAYPVLSFGVTLLGINDYLASAVSSLVEIPGIVFSWIVMEKMGRKWSMFITMGIGGLACIATIIVPASYVMAIVVLTNIGKFCIAGAWAIIYVYGAELFPTALRNSAISAASLLASAASIISPYILELKSVTLMLPFVVIGGFSVVSAFVTLYLPETLNKHLPQTIEESEALVGHVNWCSCFSSKENNYKIKEKHGEENQVYSIELHPKDYGIP